MNAPFKTDALPEWNLTDLYVGREDPRIETDMAAAKVANDELASLEGLFLQARAEPERLGLLIDRGIRLYEQATNSLWSVGAYAGLASSVAKDDPAWSKFEGDLRARSAGIAAESLFFTLELNKLEDSEIEAALKARPAARRWTPWLRRVRLSRPHELSPDLERFIVDKSPGVANWVRLYDETLAKLQAKVGGESLTLPEALNRLSDPDVDRRKAAADGLAAALEAAASTQALVLNTLAFEKQVEDRWRHYAEPAQARHLSNEVDADAVNALEAAVVEAYPRLSHRYYALKARIMGVEALDYWDRNAPLDAAAPRTYDWTEAQAIVLDSFQALAPKFAENAKTFFVQPWIDARPRPASSRGPMPIP
jgi:oligoendopeptidase F